MAASAKIAKLNRRIRDLQFEKEVCDDKMQGYDTEVRIASAGSLVNEKKLADMSSTVPPTLPGIAPLSESIPDGPQTSVHDVKSRMGRNILAHTQGHTNAIKVNTGLLPFLPADLTELPKL